MAKRHRRGRPVHGILLLDKPAGGSSNRALQRAKRLFGAAKAGHTGSLDPLATGMLPICFGEATKLSAFLLDADKGYETTIALGVTTDSADADGDVLETRRIPAELDANSFQSVCQKFTGAQMQVPPMVSAIKIDGQRLYKLARQGKTVDRPPRPVTIHKLEVLSFSGNSARLAVRCSKGTYIRSLVSDIGEAIGCGAHVTSLRRTFVAPFEQQPMILLDTLEKMLGQLPQEPLAPTSAEHPDAVGTVPNNPDSSTMWPALDALLLPVDAGLQHIQIVRLDKASETDFLNGNPAACTSNADADPENEKFCRVYNSDGRLVGLGELSGSRTVSPRRVLQWG